MGEGREGAISIDNIADFRRENELTKFNNYY